MHLAGSGDYLLGVKAQHGHGLFGVGHLGQRRLGTAPGQARRRSADRGAGRSTGRARFDLARAGPGESAIVGVGAGEDHLTGGDPQQRAHLVGAPEPLGEQVHERVHDGDVKQDNNREADDMASRIRLPLRKIHCLGSPDARREADRA